MTQPAHAMNVGGDATCLLCPICVLLQALDSTRPEVTAHLLAAARELALAAAALVGDGAAACGHDEAPDSAAAGTSRLRPIRID